MFDKAKFGAIIKRINDSYPTQHEFADYSGVNRTYLSQYINMKLNTPPKPKILKKIADSSRGITNYHELMEICGYIIDGGEVHVHQSIIKTDDEFLTVPIFINNNGSLEMTKEDVVLPFKWDHIHQYFGYRATDDSMLPLLR